MKKRLLFTVCLVFFCVSFFAALPGDRVFPGESWSFGEEGGPADGHGRIAGQVYKREVKKNNQVLYLRDVSIIQNNQVISTSNIILYDSRKTTIRTGNRIQADGELFLFDEAGNPGNFDQKAYYARQEICAGAWAEKITVTDAGRWVLRDSLENFRQKWKQILYQAAGEEDGSILSAMILGDKGNMDPEIKELYQVNGIAHILAISGLHLSFIGVGSYQFLRRRTGSYAVAGAAGVLFLLLYVLMIGASISAVRALIMFLFRVGADISGRAYDMLTALGAAAAAIVLWQPQCFFDGAFQMSFGAILGIWMAGLFFEQKKETGYKKWRQALLSSAGVQMFLLPILLYHYFEFPLYSVFLNLFVIPLMSVLLLLGMAGSLFAVFLPPAGGALFWICARILDLYEAGCRLALELPGSRITVGQPEIQEIWFYYGALAVTAGVWVYTRSVRAPVRKRERGQRRSFAALAAGICVLFLTPLAERRDGMLVTMLDVGQGDGICIQGQDGTNILVDGGSSDVEELGRYRLEPFLKSRGIRRLDYVFLTHGDEDHTNGIEEMLLRQKMGIEIVRLVLPEEAVWDDRLEKAAETARASGTRVLTMRQGQLVEAGKIQITCLHPGREEREPGNAASLVLDVAMGNFDLLLTGDVEGEGEEALCEKIDKEYDVLKIAHHGSKNSTLPDFLDKVNPKTALISAGEDNQYGHPHKETLDRLHELDCQIYETARCGAVTIKTDGDRMTVTADRKE